MEASQEEQLKKLYNLDTLLCQFVSSQTNVRYSENPVQAMQLNTDSIEKYSIEKEKDLQGMSHLKIQGMKKNAGKGKDCKPSR